MSVSKVVKSKQCYLHPKTNSDNMHIYLNFIFKKRACNKWEQYPLLKVKLSLETDQRWLLLLSLFSKFSRGGPPDPPSRLEIYGKNQTLEAETQFKYLGVDISSNLSWNQHIDRIVKKAIV